MVTKKKRANQPPGETEDAELLQAKAKFRKKIRDLRLERKLTLEELEERSGITSNHLSKIEGGKVEPRLDSLQAIAKGLQVPAEVLVNGRGIPTHGFSEHGVEMATLYNDVLSPEEQEAIMGFLKRYPNASPEDRQVLLRLVLLAEALTLSTKP